MHAKGLLLQAQVLQKHARKKCSVFVLHVFTLEDQWHLDELDRRTIVTWSVHFC